MTRLDAIRNREAARICLVRAIDQIMLAQKKLAEIDPTNQRFKENFARALQPLDDILFVVVDDQEEEVAPRRKADSNQPTRRKHGNGNR